MYVKFKRVLRNIKSHLEFGTPFSVVRIGDGDLKLLWELKNGRINKQKFSRSGIPHKKIGELIQIYRDGCNSATYTSSFEHYFTPRMWNRKFSSGTADKVRQWKKVYRQLGIENTKFCSPEIGFLFFINEVKFNLFNQMKGKKVCIITNYKHLKRKFDNSGCDVDVFTIPGIGKGHYSVYHENVSKLKGMIDDYDMFLVSAGALGKGYSFHIKSAGGIVIDVGQITRYWISGAIADRYKGILTKADNYTVKFTKKAEKFAKFL